MLKYRFASLLILFALMCATPLIEAVAAKQTAMSDALESALQSSESYKHRADLQRFYKEREYKPLWLDADGDWKEQPDGFVQAIRKASQHGLNPQHYPLEPLLERHKPSPDIAQNAAQELAVTDMAMDYLKALRYGVVNPTRIFPDFFTPDNQRDLAWPMQQVIDNGATAEAINAQAPQMSDYARLRESLANYRQIAESGGWEPIVQGAVIKPGNVDERVPAIRERLQILGRLDSESNFFASLRARMPWSNRKNDTEKEPVAPSKTDEALAKKHPDWVYGEDLQIAIRAFQERTGAKPDGVIGAETLGELNTPVEERITQILLAMEQWRWLPHDLGSRYVLVNTAGYYAKAVDNNRVIVNTPVIVGQVEHPTPSFSSYITNVKFYPDWTVPSSIAKRYVLEKIRTNPEVVNTLGYELHSKDGQVIPLTPNVIAQLTEDHFPPYRFRQKPGPQNALGLVRFSVENDYAIYLHDTPKDDLFSQNNRNFSSGCVRVGEPAKMAQFLLAGNANISEGEVAEKFAVANQPDLKTEVLPLETKIPVHIMYMTAWIDDANNIHFESDPYKRDAKLRKAMGI
jgi:murein L,D-transpeptidase YcbB/YkuD